ncbi:MAG: hypothetical protein MJ090_03900 [Clostridia bacterium]|nr:hypothetical protein [Clostridia bacterium]
MAENIHSGHRERLKKEFLDGNFNSSTPDHKWLELLLFFCINRSDTNPLAHELINKYKTLDAVFEAPVNELIKFNGLTKNNVPLLKMIIPLARKIELQKSDNIFNALHPDNINEYVLSRFYGLTTEQMGIVCIDQLGKIIDFKFLSEGDIGEVSISTRNIIKYVLEKNASCVIIAHNHPKSFALPSKADIDATVSLRKILEQINVRLIDHIIVSGSDYVSLAQSQEYKSIFI